MKQRYINNSVVYLGRTILFTMLIFVLLFVTSVISSRLFVYRLIIVPILSFVLVISIGSSLFSFFEQLGKVTEK